MKRIYHVVLLAPEKDFIENEELPPLKQKFLDYIQLHKMLTEEQVIRAIRAGQLIKCVLEGVIEDDE